MLSSRLYELSKKYDEVTKYNISYDKLSVLNLVCAFHITDLLKEKYPLDSEQKGKLESILNNLIVL